MGDIGLLDWHQRSGLTLLGLLVFRLGWGLWGGRYARWGNYWTTPVAFVDHFQGKGTKSAHTSARHRLGSGSDRGDRGTGWGRAVHDRRHFQ